MISRHRLVLGAILIGNAVAFAGVDPPTRLATALLVVLLVADLKSISAIPNAHRLALIAVAALVVAALLVALVPVGVTAAASTSSVRYAFNSESRR